MMTDAVWMPLSAVGVVVGIFIVSELVALLHDPFSGPLAGFNASRWCCRNSLRKVEWVGPDGMRYWCGKDADGICYIPGPSGECQHIGKMPNEEGGEK